MLPVAVARPPLTIECNTWCTSGFVDDVMFSHNGENRYRLGVYDVASYYGRPA